MSDFAACLICGADNDEPVFRHEGPISITSTATAVTQPTIVYVCRTCAHVQTPPLANIEHYYDSSYKIRLESDTADDLYAVRDGVTIYRSDHQAAVALQKLDLPPGSAVLDYGCGKGMSLRRMLELRPDLSAAVFDVSDAYRPVWDAFIRPENQAAYRVPAHWQNGAFDAVLSFFALEHVADPVGFLREIRTLLRPNGKLHLTVPNVRRNVGDFVVVDHVNHFMPTSLRRAFADAGFVDVEIDEDVHEAAFVVDASRGSAPEIPRDEPQAVASYVADAHRYAAFWSAAGDGLAQFDRGVGAGHRSAIYGSGFYGVFIASRLRDHANVAYFLDRNPHQQDKRVFDLPVLRPEQIGDDIDVVYVGLNPERARKIVEGVEPLHRRPREMFFLE